VTVKLRQVVGGEKSGTYYALLIDPDSGKPIHRVLLWETPGDEFLDLIVSFYPRKDHDVPEMDDKQA
jgi:hypothetical protein